jgi:hypothetical protein
MTPLTETLALREDYIRYRLGLTEAEWQEWDRMSRELEYEEFIEWTIKWLEKMNITYYYSWKNNEKRLTLYHRKLIVLQRMVGNSALVRFENGDLEVISRNAIRKIVGGRNELQKMV